MKLLVSTRGPCWAVAGQDRHFASQPHGVELNHPCGLTVDGTSPSASMCPSPSRVRLRQRTAPSRSEDALIRGGHPGTRCMTRLTVTGNECRRRVPTRRTLEYKTTSCLGTLPIGPSSCPVTAILSSRLTRGPRIAPEPKKPQSRYEVPAGPCKPDRHFASQPHGVELNHPCGLTVDATSPSASMCPSPSRVRLRQRTAPSRSEDALIRGGHPGTRCMTRLTVTGNECRRRVVVTPQKCGDVYLYDLPASRGSPAPPSRHDSPLNSNNEHLHNSGRYTTGSRSSVDNGGDVGDCYDVPPRAVPVIPSPASSPSPAPSCYDIPRPPTSCTPNSNCSGGSGVTPLDCYDVPRPLQPLTPSSSASSLTNDGSLSGSNRSSLAAPDYDVPRSRLPASSLPSRHNTPVPKTPTPPPPPQTQQIYDVPVSKELPLELDSALEGLQRLQSEASAAIARLLGFVSPGWRTPQRLDATLMDLRLAALRLRTSLHDLAEFAEGTLGNAGKAPDKGLATKLRPLVKALRDSDKLVQEAATELDAMEWDAGKLCRGGSDTPTPTNGPPSTLLPSVQPDPLDQLIACARALTEDVRQVASFIQVRIHKRWDCVSWLVEPKKGVDRSLGVTQGNSTLLFKRSSIISTGSSNNSGAGEDYDYVNLDSREVVAKQREEVRASLPQELRSNYDLLVSESDNATIQMPPTTPTPMDPNDKQLLAFYAAQVITHGNHLTHAIDAFMQTVEHNQPPKASTVFLAHGKFVVLSAHRLVHIGDTVHRNVTRNDVRTRVLQCANALNEALAQTVSKTKQAAQFFPSVSAVQEMVDSVVDVSHLAKDLKVAMIHAAQQP
ncbi:Breast cancer anti-estrogen resistance protein 1 [Eufriesea mexicana]|uniref:Breast cancer anti-estrogen resistance protein 1 n=1 Tax=Eufriesea mexicana TaxID=516756 RepID=A0A310SP84_9HYME|nr:Breast cancer anti-estrogen resistance protein 1 [Eufriesea mexicana]